MTRVSAASVGDLPKGLEKELLRLRRGGGVHHLDSPDRLGPLLGEILHRQGPVDEDFRSVVVDLLLRSAANRRQRWLVAIAYGADPQTTGGTLTERLLAAGRAMDRDLRTVQRRVDEYSRTMAGNLAVRLHELRARPAYYPPGWALDRFFGDLDLTQERPRLIEHREIVVREDGLDHIDFSVSLLGVEPGPDAAIEVAARQGCTVKEVTRDNSRFWTVRLELPTALAYGSRHRCDVALTMPHRNNLTPLYGLSPLRACHDFEARVRFAHPADVVGVWSFTGIPQTILDFLGPGDGEPLGLDEDNSVGYRVEHLVQGLCYGVRWQWRDPPDGPDTQAT